jgi:hypothetical protein
MRLVVCTSDDTVCPPSNISTVALTEAMDPALLGINPESVAKVWAWGFGVVLLSFLLGYCVSLAIGVIRKV